MNTNQELIATLRAGGYNNAQIARALGRDSRVISQITKGEKPYKNLTPALERLVQTKGGAPLPSVNAPRRTTAAGKVARTRAKPQELTGGRAVPLTGGRKTILKEINRAKGENRRIKVSVKVSRAKFYGKSWEKNPPPIQLYQKGGYSAEKFQGRVDNLVAGGMTPEKALEEVIKGDLMELGYLDAVGAIEKIQLNTADSFSK